MKTNFNIEDNFAVQYEGRHIDLHNNFDFEGMTEDIKHKEIRLEFKKINGEWVKESEFSYLTFILKNVTYKYFEEGDSINHPENSKCLGEISFFPSDMRDINDSVIPQKESNENDDLIFLFLDSRVIRVNCEQVELKVKE